MTSNGSRVFNGHPSQVKTVRDWIGHVIASHDGPVDPDDAQLVVSELFTNALLHGPSGGRVLVCYCLWRDGGRIVVCDAGGATVPRLGDPAASDLGGRGLCVVDAIAARWDGFRIGQVQVVWCDLGKPLDGAVGDAWAWLAKLLADVPLVATASQIPHSRPGQLCGSLW